jgi:hypothetical protein
MKQTLTTYQAAQQLHDDKDGGWTWNGAQALVEYLEELEADMGEEIEFDRVALRCDFSEYESLVEWAEGYFGDDAWRGELNADIDDESGNSEDIEDVEEKIREYIHEHGQLIEFNGGIIVSSF